MRFWPRRRPPAAPAPERADPTRIAVLEHDLLGIKPEPGSAAALAVAMRKIAACIEHEPMTDTHQMSWERDTTQWVDDNNWVHTEPTGVTSVSCSCGFTRDVTDSDVERVMQEHMADAAA